MAGLNKTTVAELARRVGGVQRLEQDVPLAPLTTFKIGGPADYLFRATSAQDMVNAITAARELEMPHFVLGLGANILMGDKGFRGLIIRSEQRGIDFLDDTRVRAAAGEVVFPDLIVATVERELGGLQHYVGIPSSVGGAIWQNLHFLSPPPERERTCFIAEVLESCEILTEENEVLTVNNDYFQFGYDYSILHERADIVLSATFRLEHQPKEVLRYNMRENLQWRDDRHPDLWLYPSAGSIFQKIEGVGAGRLIDQCGLKGHVHGRAEIFHKHANVIVNLGGATAAEIRYLIDLAQTTVREKLGYELKTEIGFIGEF